MGWIQTKGKRSAGLLCALLAMASLALASMKAQAQGGTGPYTPPGLDTKVHLLRPGLLQPYRGLGRCARAGRVRDDRQRHSGDDSWGRCQPGRLHWPLGFVNQPGRRLSGPPDGITGRWFPRTKRASWVRASSCAWMAASTADRTVSTMSWASPNNDLWRRVAAGSEHHQQPPGSALDHVSGRSRRRNRHWHRKRWRNGRNGGGTGGGTTTGTTIDPRIEIDMTLSFIHNQARFQFNIINNDIGRSHTVGLVFKQELLRQS